MAYSENRGFVLPTEEMENPRNAMQYAHGGGVGYVFSKPERTRPTRVVLSSGDLGENWAIGTVHLLQHDQTSARLGRYTVVGIVYFDNDGEVAAWEGDVPDRKLASAVFK